MKTMKTQIYIYSFLALIVVMFTACDENDFSYQDTSSRLRLTSEKVMTTHLTTGAPIETRSDSVLFSLRMLSAEATEGIVRFEAILIGSPEPRDRTFKLEVVEEGTNVPSSVYELVEPLIMPANADYSTVSVKVKRTVPGLNLTDPAIKACVRFRVAPNENFLTHEDNTAFTVMWNDCLAKPASWTSSIDMYLGQFNQSLYRFYIEVTGETELTKFGAALVSALTLRTILREKLADYNAQADLDGRPHWKADDGVTDLVI